MSNKINMTFFNAYIELDKVCAQSLGVNKGGVTTYINRLVELRLAPGRNDVLPKLLAYRKIRNIIAHEENAFAVVNDVTKKDVQWLNRFAKSVARKRDPVSQYNRKAHRYSIWKKVRLIFFALLILLVASAVVLGLKTIGII
jgi:hypothetical protein